MKLKAVQMSDCLETDIKLQEHITELKLRLLTFIEGLEGEEVLVAFKGMMQITQKDEG
jgi:hypothetical protein